MKQCCLCGKYGHDSADCQWIKDAKERMLKYATKAEWFKHEYRQSCDDSGRLAGKCHQSNQS